MSGLFVRGWYVVLALVLAGGGLWLSVRRSLRDSVLGPVGRIRPAAVILTPAGGLMEDKRLEVVVRDFVHYWDSLRADPVGRVRYDSLMRVRPGLLDSARAVEGFIIHGEH